MYVEAAVSSPSVSLFMNWNIGGFVWTSGNTYSESDQVLVQVTQGGCGLSILGDIKTSGWATGSRWPCLSRGVGPDDLWRSFPTSTILCDSFPNFIPRKWFYLSCCLLPILASSIDAYCYMNNPFIYKAEGEKGYRRSILLWISVM